MDKIAQGSLFYSSIDNTKGTSLDPIIKALELYSDRESKQVYVLDRILGSEKRLQYSISNVAIILIPKHRIILLNYGNNSAEAMEDFQYDFADDLAYLSTKFDYSKILGRQRGWDMEALFLCENASDFDLNQYLKVEMTNAVLIQRIDLLISLAIGSINSIEKIGTELPTSVLERVKRKIVLFDGQQTRFIYSHDSDSKRITIQGLAGTGKTELLLNKLKDIYISDDSFRVVFTCFNKVLATEMRLNRIPQFFNSMQVSKQIEWGTRLHAFSSWGSNGNPETGLYSYITSYYSIPFYRYAECKDFGTVCRMALKELNAIEDFSPCFDYVFIDESQDFSEDFFLLCEKVTRVKLIVAGDIFQNIFDSDISTKQVDFLLNQCYRTDPKTLMFAHAIGMGLYEQQKVNWLSDEGWGNCGYDVKRSEGKIQLSRRPLRRFEDLDATDTIRFTLMGQDEVVESTIKAIESILFDYNDATPDDIAVVVLNQDHSTLVNDVNRITYAINDTFGWQCNKGFETKRKIAGTVYVSNINNIKGLEFPFLVCVCDRNITNGITIRNQIYTILTRSFLVSYFLIQNQNQEFYTTYTRALQDINHHGYIEVVEPSEAEKRRIETRLEEAKKQRKSDFESIMEKVLRTNPNIRREMIEVFAKKFYNECESDDEIIEKLMKICKAADMI